MLGRSGAVTDAGKVSEPEACQSDERRYGALPVRTQAQPSPLRLRDRVSRLWLSEVQENVMIHSAASSNSDPSLALGRIGRLERPPRIREGVERGSNPGDTGTGLRFTGKGQCSDCNRGTQALFRYGNFLAWRRCSKCWTPEERELVKSKRYRPLTRSPGSVTSPGSPSNPNGSCSSAPGPADVCQPVLL